MIIAQGCSAASHIISVQHNPTLNDCGADSLVFHIAIENRIQSFSMGNARQSFRQI